MLPPEKEKRKEKKQKNNKKESPTDQTTTLKVVVSIVGARGWARACEEMPPGRQVGRSDWVDKGVGEFIIVE